MAYTVRVQPGEWYRVHDALVPVWFRVRADPLNTGMPVPVTVHTRPLKLLCAHTIPGFEVSEGPPPICDEPANTEPTR